MCKQAVASTYTMCKQDTASTYTMCKQGLPNIKYISDILTFKAYKLISKPVQWEFGKKGIVRCETLTQEIPPYTYPLRHPIIPQTYPIPMKGTLNGYVLGYPWAPTHLDRKGRVKTELLIATCNVKDRDWQSWLDKSSTKWGRLQAVGRHFYDSPLTHQVADLIFVTCITV